MKKVWHDDAWEDYVAWQTQDKINTEENQQTFD